MLIFVQLAAYPLVTVVWVKLWVSDILWDILYFVPDLVFLASQVSDQNCLNWPVQSLIDHPSLVMPNIEHNLVQYLPQSFWSLFLAPSSGEPVSKLPQKSNELNKKSFKLMLARWRSQASKCEATNQKVCFFNNLKSHLSIIDDLKLLI